MPQGYHHVTQDIRSQIYALKAIGTSLHKISAIVGRHVSTVSREIKRNTGGRGYRYKQADPDFRTFWQTKWRQASPLLCS